MSTATTAVARENALVLLWRNKGARAVILQIITIALLFAFIGYMVRNAVINLETIGKGYSFDFLSMPASYDINQTLIEYNSRDSHLRAMYVGILNTLLVAGCGIFLATIIGFVFGVMRLSRNWLINRIVYCYIEYVRNVPVLLHILLVHGLLVNILPVPKRAIDWGETFYFTNRGFYVPRPIPEEGFWLTGVTFVIGIAFIVWFRRYAKGVQDRTGKIYPVFLIGVASVIGLPAVVLMASGMPLSWEIPYIEGFNFKGGLSLKPEFLALWLALSFYTSAFIAEIVRAGIMAVSHGQTEAAYALGLRPNQTLNLIVIPQALRVIIPPLTSQYLNLTKNSSLAIAIGYMDIIATIGGISLNQTGREMECMTLVLAIYLSFSLLISAFMNWYNKTIKLVEH